MSRKKKVNGRLGIYLQWPLILGIFVIIMNVAVAFADLKAGALMGIFTVIYLAVVAFIYFFRRKSLLSGLVEFSEDYAWVQKMLLTDLDIPYALTDENGKILWMNTAFKDLISEEGNGKHSLVNLFEDVDREFLSKLKGNTCIHTSFCDRKYRMDIRPVAADSNMKEAGLFEVEPEANEMLAIYLFDETDILTLSQEINDQKMVVGLMDVDNYDETLESVEEVRRSLLMALIDRKINKYISGMDGIVKKLEKDKYFFVIKHQYIDTIREERFAILDDIKTVNIGNEMSATLSIGIGMDADTYGQNYELARMALDMALGRGGDQAVIKSGQKTEYFGGKSQSSEKTTRVKARVKAQSLRELIENKDRVIIMGHRNADIDSFGASVGLYRIATALNKKANVILNDVSSSLQPMVDRFLGNPEYPEDLIIKGDKASELLDANSVLIVADVDRPSITEEPGLLDIAKTVVVLDHHRQSAEIIENAELSYVEPFASSTCEMVAEILQYIADDIKLTSQEADAMYAGIVIDTNNFQNQAGVRTFEAAAYLRRNGADISRVRKLFRDDFDDYKARAQVIGNSEIFEGAFAISECEPEDNDNPTVIAAQAANELLDIRGIKASIVMCQYNGVIYLSARSIDEVNVQVMMERLGGGGHRSVAGAQLEGVTMDEAKERLKDVISDMIEKGEVS